MLLGHQSRLGGFGYRNFKLLALNIEPAQIHGLRVDDVVGFTQLSGLVLLHQCEFLVLFAQKSSVLGDIFFILRTQLLTLLLKLSHFQLIRLAHRRHRGCLAIGCTYRIFFGNFVLKRLNSSLILLTKLADSLQFSLCVSELYE